MRWLGFVGVVLLTLTGIATGTAKLGIDTAPALGRLAACPAAALAVGLTGMGLVVLAWLQIGRTPPEPGWSRWTLALWGTPLLFVPPLFSGDIHSYLAQGEIAARGLDPYAVGPLQGLGPADELTRDVSVYWQETPSPYGPVFTAIERVIAQLTGGDVVGGIAAHRIVEVAGLLLIVWATPKLAERSGISPSAALWLGVLNPLVLWHFVAGLHNDALMLGLMVAGTELALGALDRGRFTPLACGVVLIALSANVKIVGAAALAVVGTVLARRWGGRFRHLLLAGLAMAAAFAVVTVAVSLGTGAGFGWLQTLGTSGAVNSWMAPTNWLGFLAGGVGALFGATITQTAIGVGKAIGAALAVVAVGKLVWAQLRGRTTAPLALGMIMTVVVVLGPAVQPWYLVWAAVPLAACLPDGRARTVLTSLLALFSVLLPPLAGSVATFVLGYAIALVVLALVVFVLWKARLVSIA